MHPWEKSYPQDVRWDAPIPTMAIPQVLDEAAERWAGNHALDFMGRRYSYPEFKALAERAAAGFQRLGVGPGVKVGLFLPNSPHYPIAFFGVLKAGGIVVNYSPLDAEKVLEHKIEDSETDFLVTLDVATLYPQMARMLGRTRLKKLIVGEIAEMAANPDGVRAHLQKAGMLAPVGPDPRHMRFSELLDNDGRFTPHPLGALTEDVAVIQYTGGTTGTPKGAMLTHANITSACSQLLEARRSMFREGEDRILVVLPLFHIYGLSAVMVLGMRVGAELVLHTRFDPEAAVKDIAGKRITGFPGVPTMFAALLALPGLGKHDLTSLRFCTSGGAPLPVELANAFEQTTGCSLTEGWGMTETSPVGTFTPRATDRRPASCGLPVPGMLMKVVAVDDPARDMPLGERGEICVKGPNIMKGYWKNPAATAASMTPDGFFRTGDGGYMDADGYVYIVDRIKDMILCGGYNVYPRNIEEAIYEHPSVSEVIVIGIHDAYRGQSPKAFVKLKPGAAAFSLDELKTFLKDRLGKHEMVQALEIRAELPKTPVGKLSKKELYAEEAKRLAESKETAK
jgi:long-chain acyl-CoA synthetase